MLAIGNPGAEYASSRHNVGWWVANRLLQGRHVDRFAERECDVARIRIGGAEVLVAYPQNYVNNSGAAAAHLQLRYDVDPGNMIVVYDDINLDVGVIRVRRGGSSGRHNGMESIIRALDTRDFPRVRVGVSKQGPGEDQIDYVLSAPTADELAPLMQAVDRAADAVRVLIQHGVEEAMDRYNRRPQPEPEDAG